MNGVIIKLFSVIWYKIRLAGFQENYFVEKVICVASVWYFKRLSTNSFLGKPLFHCGLIKISPYLKVLPVGRFFTSQRNSQYYKGCC